MPTFNELLLHGGVSHAVNIERYKAHEVAKMVALLNKADDDLELTLQKRLSKIRDRGYDLGPDTTKRLKQAADEIAEQRKELYDQLHAEAATDMKDLAVHEAVFQDAMTERAVGVSLNLVLPPKQALKTIATAQPFRGRVLKEWASSLEVEDVQRISDAVKIGLVEGQTTDEIVRRIVGTRAAQYSDGVLEISRRNAAAVVRTAITHTTNAARQTFWDANADIFEQVQWVSVLDSRTTPICRARDGHLYPIKSGPRPPAHWNCLPGDALVTTCDKVTAASKRWYDGDLIVIRTASGHEVSCTPNHPILTDKGWAQANSVNFGSKILRYVPVEGPTSGVNGNGNNVPTRIEDIAEAFFSSGEVVPMPMPTTAKDFHGDGIDGEIAIVGTNRDLSFKRPGTKLIKHGKKSGFIMRFMAASVFLCSFRHIASLVKGTFLPTSRVVGWDKHAGSFIIGCIRPSFVHLVRNTLALIGIFPSKCRGLLDGSGDSSGFEETIYGSYADTEHLADFARMGAGKIEVDDVIFVGKRKFSGHVYNLETENHVYFSDTIINHNCRSIIVAYLGPNAVPKTRASAIGPVPGRLNYEDWLRLQPLDMQEEILGVKKAQLFRKGGLSLDRFIDNSGHEYTLDELRKRDSSIWERTFNA